MMIESALLGAAALITAVGAIVKQIYDIKALKLYICMRTPCKDRIQKVSPLDPTSLN